MDSCLGPGPFGNVNVYCPTKSRAKYEIYVETLGKREVCENCFQAIKKKAGAFVDVKIIRKL